jgi:hypothetical protein
MILPWILNVEVIAFVQFGLVNICREDSRLFMGIGQCQMWVKLCCVHIRVRLRGDFGR